jgi:hypothetical protein
MEIGARMGELRQRTRCCSLVRLALVEQEKRREEGCQSWCLETCFVESMFTLFS